jgi:site-specific DNA-methyltransferase (adenine-specific)
LGKAWDANTGALETYQECLRVLKPGGHILAFSAARTYHHLAVTLEQAGFEIRDQIMWIYSSGFPKSQDIGRSIQRSLGVKEKKKKTMVMQGGFKNMNDSWEDKMSKKANETVEETVCTDPEALQWEGWGTALKPAHEPIALARKPIKLSIAKNSQKWGTGALNIDATRVPYEDADLEWSKGVKRSSKVLLNEMNAEQQIKQKHPEEEQWEVNVQGRFPSNVIGEIPDYQKYFYCPKVSRKERHIGFDIGDQRIDQSEGEMYGSMQAITRANIPNVGNNHPTVKPIELMKYLIKLITPPGGTVLDPFNGSGSTGCAAVELGHTYIGCELDPAYVDIAEKRIAAWIAKDLPTVNPVFEELFE